MTVADNYGGSTTATPSVTVERYTPSLVVTTAVDEDNGSSNPALGTGTSLREALNYAESLSGNQTITFSPSLAGQTIDLTSQWAGDTTGSALVISGNINIDGNGETIAIDPSVQLRQFYVDSGASLTLSNLTLTGGTANQTGNLYGGAIWSLGSLTVANSTFTNNKTSGEGGALQAWGGSALLSVSNSTFYNNSAAGRASAISDGAVSSTIQDDTITGNLAGTTDGTLWLYNSTPLMQNTIIAGNTNDGASTYGTGGFASGSSNNLLGTGDWAGLTNGANANQVGVTNAGLSPIGNYGGSTPTVALLNGSPAIGTGVGISAITTDQRGLARLSSGDIGAYQSVASYYLQQDIDGVHTDLWTTPYHAGAPALQLTALQMSSLNLISAGGTGSITIDESNGLIPGGVTVTGGSNTSLLLIGTGGGDTLAASASELGFDGTTISFGQMSSVSYNPGAGTDSLNLAGGTLNLAASAAGAGLTTRLFSTVQISAGATLRVQSPVSASDRSVIVTSVLSIAGSTNAWTGLLDLGANDLIVRNGNLALLQNQMTTGLTGEGIISSATNTNRLHSTTLGILLNDNGDGSRVFGVGAPSGLFDGQDATSGDVLIKYTYDGDANFDGKVDGSDYSRIDSGFTTHATGWANGDFNYDGVVDGSDYTLIDNAFNTQAASLTPTTSVNLTTGFANAGTSITTNGCATVYGNNLLLTPNTASQTGSAYYTSKLTVSGFTSDLTFTQSAGAGDGSTFTIQNSGINAVGGSGGSLGYAGINNSLAIKFDLYDNAGEGNDSTGLYLNGTTPTDNGSIDLFSTGINFHSGDTFRAAISYAGNTLNVILTDLNTGASAQQTYTVNIAAVIGSNTAWFGFTAATGGATALQQINGWAVYN